MRPKITDSEWMSLPCSPVTCQFALLQVSLDESKPTTYATVSLTLRHRPSFSAFASPQQSNELPPSSPPLELLLQHHRSARPYSYQVSRQHAIPGVGLPSDPTNRFVRSDLLLNCTCDDQTRSFPQFGGRRSTTIDRVCEIEESSLQRCIEKRLPLESELGVNLMVSSGGRTVQAPVPITLPQTFSIDLHVTAIVHLRWSLGEQDRAMP
jgi:hypothetical protein